MEDKVRAILIGLIAAGLVGTVFYMLGGVVENYIIGFSREIATAIGTVGGFALGYLKEE